MHRRITLVAILAAAAASTPGRADLLSSSWISESSFHYEVNHMPDFDQRRQGDLLGNGSMHCVPTSCTNMIAYAINHGFDEISPGGPTYWAGQGPYDSVSQTIALLGNLMGTNLTNGTTEPNGSNGLATWLLPSDKFTVSTFLCSTNWCPQGHDIAQAGINGSLVSFCYGRYDVNGTHTVNDTPLPQLDRDGGHCVTLRRALRNTSQTIWYRDPADDGTNSTQSTFGDQMRTINDLFYATAFNDANVQQMSRLDPPDGDGKLRIIDGYTMMTPKQGFAFTDDQLQPISPWAFDGLDQLQNIPTPTHNNGVGDLVMLPEQVDFLALYPGVGGPAEIRRLGRLDGADVLVATVGGATKMVLGRGRELYVLAGTTVECRREAYDSDDYILEGSATLPCVGHAIAYDDATDEVVVLCGVDGTVHRLPRGLPTGGGGGTTTTLPAGVPLNSSVCIDVAPDGALWLASAGDTDTLFRLVTQIDGTMTATPVDLPDPQATPGVALDDGGHVFACTTEGLIELAPGKTGGWSVVPGSAFGAFEVSGCFRIARSRPTAEAGVHDTPEWDNIPAEELAMGTFIPDCPADVNGDGVVGVDDLVAVITAWGTDDPAADIAPPDGDDVVGVDDLVLVITEWGACP